MSRFDSVSFSRVEAPEPEAEAPITTRTPASSRAASSGGGGGGSAVVFGSTGDGEPPEAAIERSVTELANVHPAPVVLAESEAPDAGDSDVSAKDVLIGLLLVVPLVGIGGIFGQDLWAQSRRRRE